MFARQSLSIGALGALLSLSAVAQAPAGAPAGATGVCKDGSYWTGASKRGACSGHHGVQSWYADSTAAQPTAPAAAAGPPAGCVACAITPPG